VITQDQAGVKYTGLVSTLRRVHAEGGGRIGALFAGLQPRVMWISIGGFVFFGTYEFVKNILIRAQ
jgi:solute carrier family 25 S-adenosylmethionine transporter 26